MFPVLLYIDDRVQLLPIRKNSLEPFGFSVVHTDNARSAISILEKSLIAAILLEYKTEGLDAEAIAYHIKQRYPDQPIILLSAYSEMPERILWLVDDYVLKSEPVDQLVDAIRRFQTKKPASCIPNSISTKQAAG
jgi:CheY-like chemotaxis protein